jgi:chemotaxis protein methyltransferase CheR
VTTGGDAACVAFLQWALPRLELRWAGFRKVRRQVCRRLVRRLRELALPDLAAYRALLESRPEEWAVLDGLCRITISRFCRDRGVFEALARDVLPELATLARRRGEAVLRLWSAGCGAGEEPYGLVLAWELASPPHPGLALRVLATDVDPALLARARSAVYRASSLREVPPAWREAAFDPVPGGFRLRARFRAPVELSCQDLRADLPDERFQAILCRNLAFTYFAEPLQRRVLERLASRLVPGGALVLGRHEALPAGAQGFAPWEAAPGVLRRAGTPA